ncbi:50S ribosomal protein L13 [Candidatus Woesearchaeota archaeon]|nr:50S ribosomal protein L13 [Candidatus Woesearchaeota archaeon]MCF7901636.1 50S ribosomal protein L13 [Candidatus Woesearchaeota archaeon]MCF8012986.1 50S ribosomal protein L13 [Candidatus Woesearchaeota archaeon]
MIVVDAKDIIIGRLGTFVAKKALMGEVVHIVNAEESVITGKPKEIFATFKRARERGAPLVGPYFPRQPQMIVKRTIRGMLPYKKPRGREALARIKCHIGVPETLKNEEIKVMEKWNVHNTNAKFIHIKDISKQLGAKFK